ncbi:hypothetical protein VMUT_0142 [Vulcanisaeta moutnovskia 768-28]|uniref:Uncharacterized protein n=1 Tax=Vulcanisaeta moutnovskia (strain 768-28) TaxID=985053 RepID=F0QST7_VULM7|nr:hypothetical protein VMUT_0142 [Vulcanisaeta moutnovskia 768-28]
MDCWLVFVRDCSRPCNCLSEHPLALSSNPGIAENDNVIIIDEEIVIPCCIATVNKIKTSQINNTSRVYIYLKNCSALNEYNMNKVMRVIRSMNPVITVINIDQSLCAMY